MGLASIVIGTFILLGSAGVIRLKLSSDVQDHAWVPGLVGGLFALVGVAVLLQQLRFPGQRYVQFLLGMAAWATFAAVLTWVGFGDGSRHFSTSVSAPLVHHAGADSTERIGRFVFGAAGVFLWLLTVKFGFTGAKRLLRGEETPPWIEPR